MAPTLLKMSRYSLNNIEIDSYQITQRNGMNKETARRYIGHTKNDLYEGERNFKPDQSNVCQHLCGIASGKELNFP
jgi:hypothetical protein